jgi:hypothetical protein
MHARTSTLVTVLAIVACGGDSATGSSSGSSGSSGASGSSGTVSPATFFDACGGRIVDPASGAVDPAEYKVQARKWDRATIDCRLGPKYADLNGAKDDPRPVAWARPHQSGTGVLCKTFELQGTCSGNCDFGSTSGQALYADDDPSLLGVYRVQTYGYERGVICESPQTGGYLGGPHPDPGVVAFAKAAGEPVRLPNGFSQTEMRETNAGIMIFPNGVVGATGNQTAGASYPSFRLPPSKVPTAVAVTSYNELALVTVWDTDAVKAQIAVFVLRADSPAAFSVPYFGLPNEAGFKNIQLLGYVDLPDMKTPTAIAASGDNAATQGGYVPGFDFGSQTNPAKNILTSQAARDVFGKVSNDQFVATSGYAVVASRWEGIVSFVDLKPIYQLIRSVYFGTDDAKRAQAGNTSVWPFNFDTDPEAKPVVVGSVKVAHPTVLRVGNRANGNSKNPVKKVVKAFVGNLAGEVRMFDMSALAKDAPRPVPPSAFPEIAKVQMGRNLTSMTLRGTYTVNDTVLVTSRGDRTIEWLTVGDEPGAFVRRTLRDQRIEDPVVVDASDRGPVVTVGDFTGKKLLTFRVGKTEGNGSKPPANYGCGEGGVDAECEKFEFAGELAMPGAVYFLGTTNVN